MNDENRTMDVGIIPIDAGDDAGTQAGAPMAATLAKSHRFMVPGYELGDELGRGGMGIVYRAQQLSLGRDIALKFLREEFHPTSNSGIRFLEEARITAQLQHPGIPAVHEVGTMYDDRPYLVMKLIEGQTLDTLLKKEGPHPTRWLSIFEGICQAVGFAHSRGIIHRDLKPANVMVGAFGEVQVMDWGLAKLLGAKETLASEPQPGPTGSQFGSHSHSSVETQAGALLGTPAFMAPEQAVGDVTKVDARSDVFGLGAVLCALLTGQPPYVNRTIETTRQMAVRVDQTEANQRIDLCGATPEIIALCHRCLAGEANDRPATAAVLAAEIAKIRRDADERVIVAEREKAATEVKAAEQKKRRQLWVIAASGIVLVFAVGAIVSLIQANRAKAARLDAIVERDNARRAELVAVDREKAERLAREEAEAVSLFMQEVFAQGSAAGQASRTRQVNRSLTVKAAMDFAARNIGDRFATNPQIESSIQNTIGRTYYELGAYAEAVRHYERAVMLSEKLRGEDDAETLRLVNNLAIACQDFGDHVKAERLFVKIVQFCEQKLGPDHEATLMSTNNLAMLYDAKREYAKAEQLLTAVLASARQHRGPTHSSTLASMNNLGLMYLNQGNVKAAEPLLKEAYELRLQSLSLQHPDTLSSLNNLANLYETKKEYAEAENLHRTALTTCESVLGPEHPTTLMLVNSLAFDLESMERYEAAEPLYKRALAGRKAQFGPVHYETLATLGNLGNLYFLRKDYPKAEAIYRRLLGTFERLIGPDHETTLEVCARLGKVCEAAGKLEEAAAFLKRSGRSQSREVSPEPRRK